MQKILKRVVKAFDFDKSVKVVAWGTEDKDNPMVFSTLEPGEALWVMARSRRFDTAHTTADVRLLAQVDSQRFKMSVESTPVVFVQV